MRVRKRRSSSPAWAQKAARKWQEAARKKAAAGLWVGGGRASVSGR